MGNNFATKVALIGAVLLFFVYGIIGPHSVERLHHYSLKQALADNIHLGLDLQGGIHLVLQVKVAEAVASSTDHDVQRLEGELQSSGVTGATVGKPDPTRSDVIVISGVTAAQNSSVRTLVDGNEYTTYDVPGSRTAASS